MEAAQRRRYRAAYNSITRLCDRGLPETDPFTQVARKLRTVVGFSGGGWVRLDPDTLLPMPGLLLHAGHDQVSRIIRDEYFVPDIMKFRDLARRPVPVQTLWQVTGGHPELSTRYNAILAPLGYRDELRVVFRYGTTVWGSACLPRAVGDPPFSPDDIAFVARISGAVARGLRLSHLLADDRPADPAPPGVLILGDDGRVVSQSAAARHWLAQLPPDRAAGLDLPATILGAASQVRAPAGARHGATVSGGRVRTTEGRWLRVHASRLTPAGSQDGNGQTAVILEPARPADLSPLVLDLHGLTDRERQITQLLLRGLPTAHIAGALFISRHTLSDHMKAIFTKLGVSSRPELTALLLDRAHLMPPQRGG